MVLSLIDTEPMSPGWGQVWQSGVLASEDWDNEGLIVSMSGNENWEPPVLWVSIPDNDTYVMPDAILTAFVDAIICFLKNGKNVLIHCNEGKYRSTYMDVAVHMRAMKWPMFVAMDLVKLHHPIATLRQGTADQLKRLEAVWQTQ